MKSYSIDSRNWDIALALEMASQDAGIKISERTACNLGDPKWYDPSSHSSFHDSWVIDVKFGFRSPDAPQRQRRSICIRLVGAYHDRIIEIDYKDVLRVNNLNVDVIAHNYELLAHEFEYVTDGIVHSLIFINDVEIQILSSDVEIFERAL